MQTEAAPRSEIHDLERAALRLFYRRTANRMREQGYTYEAIGNALGVSRQRIHQIVNNREDQ